MSTQKRKFELFARLQALGFTYEEAFALRRIEMTLQRWGELECGDESGRAIEREEGTGKPFMTFEAGEPSGRRSRYPVADREAGALKRLKRIVLARNCRYMASFGTGKCPSGGFILAYHQGDCRGCMLYLITRRQIPAGANIESCYTNGLAVCC